MRPCEFKRPSMLPLSLAIGCLTLGSLSLAGCDGASNGGGAGSVSLPAPGSAPGIGDPLPPLNVQGWLSIDGATEGPQAADLEGRVVVVETYGYW